MILTNITIIILHFIIILPIQVPIYDLTIPTIYYSSLGQSTKSFEFFIERRYRIEYILMHIGVCRRYYRATIVVIPKPTAYSICILCIVYIVTYYVTIVIITTTPWPIQ